MKRIIYLLSLFLIAANAAWADDISVEQALQIARQFSATPPTHSGGAKAKSAKAASAKSAEPLLAHAVKSKTTQKDNVYVINLGEDQGFIIVSGEDGADDEILGYCDHGSFEYDKAPIQLKDLLTVYSAGVDSLRMYGAPKKKDAAKEDGADGKQTVHDGNIVLGYQNGPVRLQDMLTMPAEGADPQRMPGGPRKAGAISWTGGDFGDIIVGPLLTTTWNQWWPYNQLCPAGCPTGCVPTAVAQIINYWKHPETTKGRVHGEDEMFPEHSYDWDNMLNNYREGGYTPEQALAVAQLMADLGKALKTDYTPKGSATSTEIEWAIFENFTYSPYIEKWTANKVENLVKRMKKELNLRRPILYDAFPDDGGDVGHAMVIDGYTDRNYFHFNFGWGGDSDGYYLNAVCSQFTTLPHITIGIRPYENAGIEMVRDGLRYELHADSTADVTGYMAGVKEDINLINIPDCVTDNEGKEYKVVKVTFNLLNTNAFRKIKRLQIGNNVREIGKHAFTSCFIDQLVFGDGVDEISAMTFEGTTISELVIGSGMKRIGQEAFFGSTIQKITCKSPAIALDASAFTHSHVPDGDWSSCITELGDFAFKEVTFAKAPHFTQLEWIGKKVLDHTQGFYGDFTIPKTVRHIDPEAFVGSQLGNLKIDPDNPYYSMPNFAVVCNKNQTALTFLYSNTKLDVIGDVIPETVVKFEPRSIPTRSGSSITISNAVEDITGAFSSCEDMTKLTCLAVIPPAADDNTFNDALFRNNHHLTLYVPAGTEELYEHAPGWRRFPRIVGNQAYVPAPAPTNREYYMVLHCTGADGESLNKRLPVSKVKDIRVGDYIAQDGQTLIIDAEGKANACRVDSITWMKGFVFAEAEVFDLDPDHLEAKASDCTVRLSSCTIDEPVQLSVRKAVLTSGALQGATRELALDISLSTGEHELSGIAEIEVPLAMGEDETLMAGYLNEETGEWEPVLCTYDEKTQTARIITDHFSLFEFFFNVKGKSTRDQALEAVTYLTERSLAYYSPYYNFQTALGMIYQFAISDDPDVEAVEKWKEDLGFWQTIGLDGGYNLLKGLGFNYESVDKAIGIVGKLGTRLTILDVALADIKDDEAGVAANTIKAINSIIGSHLGTIFDTSVLSVTSGLTAFIGIALDKLGTTVQKAKLDYTRAMYRYYYSEEGYKECGPESNFGHKYLRSNKDWFDLLYPYLEKNSDGDKFQQYVEGRVRRYCDQFWEENSAVQTYCEAESKRLGFSSMLWISESDKQKVCDEYFAELINGPITSVMTAIRLKMALKAKKKYDEQVKEYVNFMNTKVGFRFKDSSCAEGETSQFSGYKVRFTDTPVDVTDGEKWECTLKENGTGALGLFTVFALANNKIKPQLTLVDNFGDDVATFDYELNRKGSRIILDFDLAKQGTPVIAEKNFEFTHNTDTFNVVMTAFWPTAIDGVWDKHTFEDHESCYWIVDYFKPLIKDFFANRKDIRIESGKVKIGNDIIGDWDEESQKGYGKFALDTIAIIKELTKEEYVVKHNLATDNHGIWGENHPSPLINECCFKFHIDCKFEIEHIDESEYVITFTGEGNYDVETERVTRFVDVYWKEDYDYDIFLWYQLTEDQVITAPYKFRGDAALKYSKYITIK